MMSGKANIVHDLNAIEFKIMVKPSAMLLYSEGEPISEEKFRVIESDWMSGKYLDEGP